MAAPLPVGDRMAPRATSRQVRQRHRGPTSRRRKQLAAPISSKWRSARQKPADAARTRPRRSRTRASTTEDRPTPTATLESLPILRREALHPKENSMSTTYEQRCSADAPRRPRRRGGRTMTFDEIVDRLGGVSNGMARCPSHEDRSPSLSVTQGEGGRTLRSTATPAATSTSSSKRSASPPPTISPTATATAVRGSS